MDIVRDKRSALLSAALELFAEMGFNGASTANIAKHAGVATGTLFVYFKTKEDLIRELFQEVMAQIDAAAMEHFTGNLPVKDCLIQGFSRILRYFLANPKEFKFVEQYHFSPLFDENCSSAGENQRFRDLLLRAQSEGVIKEAPLLVLKSIAFGPIVNLAKEHASRGTPVDEGMIEQIVQACWDGLKK